MDKLYYYNRNGVLTLTINDGVYYAGDAEFKDWIWNYDSQYGKIRNFRRNKESYPFVVTITSKDPADRDRLINAFEEDLLAGEMGCLVLRGWKLHCYIVEAKHKFFGLLDYQVAFKAVSEDSTWIRETTRSFYGSEGGSSGETTSDNWRNYVNVSGTQGRGYAYGYDAGIAHSGSIELASAGSGYVITIYGPCQNPTIYLNNAPVRVYVSVAAGERLQITSSNDRKTIEILDAAGNATNAFIYRDKENSPFLSLPQYTEVTFGDINFDLTVIERRSEPSWT